MRGGGGFAKRRPSTTGGGGDGVVADAEEKFTPGQDGSFAWNSTQPIEGRPILLYVFNGHKSEGREFDYSKSLETALFANKEVAKEARAFVCEKVCIEDHEFLRKVKGREPVTTFLTSTMEKAEQRKSSLLLLDANGALISSFDDPKSLKEGAAALMRDLKKAKAENSKRLAPAAPAKVSDAPKNG